MFSGASSSARFFVSTWRPACATEYALVGVVAIASSAHIEPTFTIAPPPRSRIASDGGLGDPVGRAQDRAERLLEVLLGLLEERDRPEDAGAVDEHVDAPEALDRVVDELVRLLARGDLAGAVATRSPLGSSSACAASSTAAGAAEDDARALLEEAGGGRAADAAASAGDQDDLVLVVLIRVSGIGHVHG